jgi:hypothetical protein
MMMILIGILVLLQQQLKNSKKLKKDFYRFKMKNTNKIIATYLGYVDVIS